MHNVRAIFISPIAKPWGSAPRRLRLGACILGALFLGLASPALADPPIWHVVSGKTDIALFGSVHLLSADTTWLTPALAQDLANADAVWFEIPIDAAGQAEAAQLALQRGLLPAGQTLSQTVGPTVWAKVERTAKAVNLPPQSLQRLKPWLAELTLSVLDFQGQGARADLGVEQQLAKAAPMTARREAFETIAEQIGFFADAPMSDQVESLNETLDEIDDDPDEFKRLAADWARGDVHAIEVEALGPMQREAPEVYKRLLVDRNKRFAQRIETLLKSDGGQPARHILIVVGVAIWSDPTESRRCYVTTAIASRAPERRRLTPTAYFSRSGRRPRPCRRRWCWPGGRWRCPGLRRSRKRSSP
jgi:uncharacterized protein YbaP (TraB family)